MMLVSTLPLLVPMLAAAWMAASNRWGRRVLYASVAWSLVFFALVLYRPRRLLAEPGEGLGRAPAQAWQSWRDRNTPQARIARLGLPLTEEGFAQSARDANLEAVDLYLDAGFDARRALPAALEQRRAEVVARLVERGDPTFEAAFALLRARTTGDDEMVKTLTSVGVTLDTADRSGETALMSAVRDRRADERAQLMGLGASVNARTRTGETALMVSVAIDDLAATVELIAGGADINAPDIDGWTPLHLATRLGRVSQVSALVYAGANVNARSRLGWTPLMWASHVGRVGIVLTLLEAGADPNAAGLAGTSPLIRAAGQGHLDAVRLLLERGADPALAVNGATARDWAVRNGHAHVVAAIDEHAGRPRKVAQ
jgi:ankyrin repeat protein